MSLKRSMLALSGAFAFLLGTPAPGQELGNMLGRIGRFKPTVTFADRYAEKVVSNPGEPGEPGYHDLRWLPQRVSAKIVANLEGFDLTEVGDDLMVGLTVRKFEFSRTLAESDEAARTGRFPARGRTATYRLPGFFLKADGDYYEKKVGSIRFAWTKTRLTVSVAVSDLSAASFPEIGASEFVGRYTDDTGTKPSGSVKFGPVPFEVSVTFGSASGSLTAYAKGVSKTTLHRFGSEAAGTLEELASNSAQIAGAADTKAPTVTAQVPARELDGDGLVSFRVDVRDTPMVIEEDGPLPPELLIQVFAENGEELADFYPLVWDGGQWHCQVDNLSLSPGKNVIVITVRDASGNTSVVTRKITAAF